MLLGDFFSIDQQDNNDNIIDSNISLNINHAIYEGHFPQQPVVPGVCMMQMLAELTSKALDKKVVIKKANQAKFLIPIIPQKHSKLNVKIKYSETEDKSLKISGSIHAEDLTFFKFKGTFA